MNTMEPGSAGGAAGFAAWKVIGGWAIVGAVAAALSAVVVMCITLPRSAREWTVGLVSTVVASISGGAYAAIKTGLLMDAVAAFYAGDMQSLYVTMCAMLGLGFFCGLPGWAVVRWSFNYMQKRADATITEVGRDARKLIAGD